MSYVKKIWKFLSSMKFAILLLLLLTGACVLGSVIPQGKSMDWYLQNYAPRTGAMIFGLSLDDVFHSAWFLILTVFLCCNLLLCNLLRLPELLRRWKNAADPGKITAHKPTVRLEGIEDPDRIFKGLRMVPAESVREDRPFRCAVKNRVGLWGAWVCHLGILLLIIGFTLGQTTKTEYTVYGVPGQTAPLGETGWQVRFDSFHAETNEDGTPRQYETVFTMTDQTGEQSREAVVRVNEPASLFGFKVYQNSTGQAARLTVHRGEELLQDEVICRGDYLVIQDTPVAVIFDGYDPAAEFDDGTSRAVYDYTLYDMNRQTAGTSAYQLEGDAAIRTSAYTVQFSEPQSYTLLQFKQDRYIWLVFAGGLMTLMGLIMSFYLQQKSVWAQQEENGSWTVCGYSRKGGALFAEQVREAAGLLTGRTEQDTESR